ncbi:phospholipase D-like domain-containing protein [Aliamphritea hakodatensis]|uniref:phospholipase D-like domain-containing protein n=1 Tax=Aliamphritea hakodatensis TaxID=2895352 RepID=UPI0022FD656E|nr:phospholipase D-like domain-containing protein [Aliamphritea hakodatensis]
MAKLLNTSATNFVLENLISKARKHVVLISPYLKLNKRIKKLIEDAILRGVSFHIVYGKQELHADEKSWLLSSTKIKLFFCDDLHAKCYLNEAYSIISSMNLYEFSQVHNYEMSILLSKKDDNDAYTDSVKEAERLIRMGQEQYQIPVLTETESPAYPLTHQQSVVVKHVGRAIKQEENGKISTNLLASKYKTNAQRLLVSLRASGFISTENGRDELTEKSMDIGAEFHESSAGHYFLWPADLNLHTMLSN